MLRRSIFGTLNAGRLLRLPTRYNAKTAGVLGQIRTYAHKLEADESVSESEWKGQLYSWKSICLCTIPLIAFGLGTWQIQRLKWKMALLDDVNDRMHRRPVALPLRVTAEEINRNEYRRVIVYGVYDHANEMLVGPRSYESEPGFVVVTPLVREDGSRVLVNRGWIKRELQDPKLRPESQITEPVTVIAFVRCSPGKNSFMPESDPESNHWFNLDLELMAKHTGSQEVLLEVIQPESAAAAILDARNGIPLGAPSLVDIKNNHLQYTLTWYAMSAITGTMLYISLRKPRSAIAQIKRLRSKAGRDL
ncbi:surf-like protein [Coemansia sp. S3946]|nr:surf-like protein [Coemansia sp. S680]KAJ2039965.1 surf-like protein [Coemansia sp. S3946]